MADQDDTTNQDELKDLRAAAEAGKAAVADAEAARREIAFVKAGIDTDSKLGKLMFKTYEGELTKDAIVAEATDLGLIKEETKADGKATEGEKQQTKQREGLSADSEDPVNTDEHVNIDQAYSEFHKIRKEGGSQDEASRAVLGAIIGSAASGDETFLVKD